MPFRRQIPENRWELGRASAGGRPFFHVGEASEGPSGKFKTFLKFPDDRRKFGVGEASETHLSHIALPPYSRSPGAGAICGIFSVPTGDKFGRLSEGARQGAGEPPSDGRCDPGVAPPDIIKSECTLPAVCGHPAGLVDRPAGGCTIPGRHSSRPPSWDSVA